jgi:hypothetical protein
MRGSAGFAQAAVPLRDDEADEAARSPVSDTKARPYYQF